MITTPQILPPPIPPKPGETCVLCNRRKPHPKKPTSPQSKPFSYRVPLDEAEAHRVTLEEAAKHLGCFDQPHWQFKTAALAYYLLLQDESLRGFAERGRPLADAEVPGMETA